jgi:hypothetical protein
MSRRAAAWFVPLTLAPGCPGANQDPADAGDEGTIIHPCDGEPCVFDSEVAP